MNNKFKMAGTVMLAALSLGTALAQHPKETKKMNAHNESIVLGGGCFWCVETVYNELKGVINAESGYAGGNHAGVSYQEVCSGNTGHAEVVKITFDPHVITRDEILHIFFTVHDPTQLNRQGNDRGTQYRSVIFYSNEAEKHEAEKAINEITKEKIWPGKIVTSLEPLKNYTRAEEYHQRYFEKYEAASEAQKASMNSGYCQFIVEPKVRKFRQKYLAKLKK